MESCDPRQDRPYVIIERRSAEGRPDRFPALMQQVVELDVDVIVTFGRPGVTADLRATQRIPIVGIVDNVLDAGLADSLARPGRNLTGVSENYPELEGKRLQLLKEAAPSISRVAVIGYRSLPVTTPQSRVELEAAARGMRIDVVWFGVDAPEELEAAYAAILRERADAVYALGTHVNFVSAKRIADFTLKQRLPSFGFPREGMLMTYEADLEETLRRVAALVKKILDGAKPADLPFEQPTKFDLIINLKTAKALGLTIP